MKRSLRSFRHRRGFTLLESVAGLALVSLIMASSTGLYVTSIRVGSTAVNQTVTSQDAATAILTVENALREARRFELMEGGGWSTDYCAQDANGAIVAVAGVHIVYPAASDAISVVTDGAGTTVTLNGSRSIVDSGSDGAYLDVYRSDAAGNPAPSNGTHLWAKGTLNGGPLPARGISLCNNVASWCGAVQFVQPCAPGTTTPLKNQMRVKLTTGRWDRVQGEVTSESTRGAVTSLTGQNVFLRNHDPSGAFSSAAHGQSQYDQSGASHG